MCERNRLDQRFPLREGICGKVAGADEAQPRRSPLQLGYSGSPELTVRLSARQESLALGSMPALDDSCAKLIEGAPRAPIPDPTAQPSSGFESSLEKRLFRKGTRPLFRGGMKPKPGDISIVDKTGTFLMWYDKRLRNGLTVLPICEKLSRFDDDVARWSAARGDGHGVDNLVA